MSPRGAGLVCLVLLFGVSSSTPVTQGQTEDGDLDKDRQVVTTESDSFTTPNVIENTTPEIGTTELPRGILFGNSNAAATPVEDVEGKANETLPWWKRFPYPLRQQASSPCECADYTCGCCAGISVERLNISQRGCLNFRYDPDEFSLEMEILMNDRELMSRSISAKNPPPMCFPIPSLVSFIPRVDLCAKLFNIFTPGRNLHACLEFSTKVSSSPVLEIQFDCLRVGADGVAVVKPDAGGGLPPDVAGGGAGGGGSGGLDVEAPAGGGGGGGGGDDYDALEPDDPQNDINKRKPPKKGSNNKKPNATTKPVNETTT